MTRKIKEHMDNLHQNFGCTEGDRFAQEVCDTLLPLILCLVAEDNAEAPGDALQNQHLYCHHHRELSHHKNCPKRF